MKAYNDLMSVDKSRPDQPHLTLSHTVSRVLSSSSDLCCRRSSVMTPIQTLEVSSYSDAKTALCILRVRLVCARKYEHHSRVSRPEHDDLSLRFHHSIRVQARLRDIVVGPIHALCGHPMTSRGCQCLDYKQAVLVSALRPMATRYTKRLNLHSHSSISSISSNSLSVGLSFSHPDVYSIRSLFLGSSGAERPRALLPLLLVAAAADTVWLLLRLREGAIASERIRTDRVGPGRMK